MLNGGVGFVEHLAFVTEEDPAEKGHPRNWRPSDPKMVITVICNSSILTVILQPIWISFSDEKFQSAVEIFTYIVKRKFVKNMVLNIHNVYWGLKFMERRTARIIFVSIICLLFLCLLWLDIILI